MSLEKMMAADLEKMVANRDVPRDAPPQAPQATQRRPVLDRLVSLEMRLDSLVGAMESLATQLHSRIERLENLMGDE